MKKKFIDQLSNRPNIVLFFTIGITVVIVFIVSLVFGPNFVEGFSSNFLSTFLGVVIGIPIALWVSDIQEKRSEKERSGKILRLLYSELKWNLDQIRWHFKNDVNFLENYGYLTPKTELWRTFSDGGEIQWIKDLTLLDLLSTAYFHIASFQSLVEWVIKIGPGNYAEFSSDPISKTKWHDLLYANMEDTIDHTQEALKKIEEFVVITDKAELTPTFQHG